MDGTSVADSTSLPFEKDHPKMSEFLRIRAGKRTPPAKTLDDCNIQRKPLRNVIQKKVLDSNAKTQISGQDEVNTNTPQSKAITPPTDRIQLQETDQSTLSFGDAMDETSVPDSTSLLLENNDPYKLAKFLRMRAGTHTPPVKIFNNFNTERRPLRIVIQKKALDLNVKSQFLGEDKVNAKTPQPTAITSPTDRLPLLEIDESTQKSPFLPETCSTPQISEITMSSPIRPGFISRTQRKTSGLSNERFRTFTVQHNSSLRRKIKLSVCKTVTNTESHISNRTPINLCTQSDEQSIQDDTLVHKSNSNQVGINSQMVTVHGSEEDSIIFVDSASTPQIDGAAVSYQNFKESITSMNRSETTNDITSEPYTIESSNDVNNKEANEEDSHSKDLTIQNQDVPDHNTIHQKSLRSRDRHEILNISLNDQDSFEDRQVVLDTLRSSVIPNREGELGSQIYLTPPEDFRDRSVQLNAFPPNCDLIDENPADKISLCQRPSTNIKSVGSAYLHKEQIVKEYLESRKSNKRVTNIRKLYSKENSGLLFESATGSPKNGHSLQNAALPVPENSEGVNMAGNQRRLSTLRKSTIGRLHENIKTKSQMRNSDSKKINSKQNLKKKPKTFKRTLVKISSPVEPVNTASSEDTNDDSVILRRSKRTRQPPKPYWSSSNTPQLCRDFFAYVTNLKNPLRTKKPQPHKHISSKETSPGTNLNNLTKNSRIALNKKEEIHKNSEKQNTNKELSINGGFGNIDKENQSIQNKLSTIKSPTATRSNKLDFIEKSINTTTLHKQDNAKSTTKKQRRQNKKKNKPSNANTVKENHMQRSVCTTSNESTSNSEQTLQEKHQMLIQTVETFSTYNPREVNNSDSTSTGSEVTPIMRQKRSKPKTKQSKSKKLKPLESHCTEDVPVVPTNNTKDFNKARNSAKLMPPPPIPPLYRVTRSRTRKADDSSFQLSSGTSSMLSTTHSSNYQAKCSDSSSYETQVATTSSRVGVGNTCKSPSRTSHCVRFNASSSKVSKQTNPEVPTTLKRSSFKEDPHNTLCTWIKCFSNPRDSITSINLSGQEQALVDNIKNLSFNELDGVQYAFYGEESNNIGYMRFMPKSGKKPSQAKLYDLNFLVLRGELTARVGDRNFFIKYGDLLNVSKGSRYSLENHSNDPALIMVIKQSFHSQ